MYVYAVRPKRNKRRTGAWRLQNSSESSEGRESAVRSERPMKAKRMAMKAVAAEGLLKSRGVGC
jgi:hypothetical protein